MAMGVAVFGEQAARVIAHAVLHAARQAHALKQALRVVGQGGDLPLYAHDAHQTPLRIALIIWLLRRSHQAD